MALLLAGIDEAGYGPTLGPLCVAMSLLRVEEHEANAAPDLWKVLEQGVCREPGRGGRPDAKGRIAVGDSKSLKLSNSVKSTHPLIHLERGVLCFSRLLGEMPAIDADLLDRLGARLDRDRAHHPCYGTGPARALPVAQTAGELAIASSLLRSAMERRKVSLEAFKVRAISERDINSIITETRNKGETAIFGVGTHLRFLWEHHASGGESCRLGVVCDRLGGRASYGPMLERELPGSKVEIIEESPARSRYVVTAPGRRMGVAFITESEVAHLPVALASMAAKFVRELAMMRFNDHWNALYREVHGHDIAPTAGYATDARRWLDEIGEDVLGRADRTSLVRMA
ncbi:MAG: hypothetical protein WCK33_11825 [Phycisphaerae bacterium]